jgi:hypothetical protein
MWNPNNYLTSNHPVLNTVILSIFFICLSLYGCSSDNDSNILRDKIGTVVNSLPCATITGYSIKIEVEGFDEMISAAVEAEFAVPDIKLKFDMEKSREEFESFACASNPYTAYKFTNVILVE